MQLIVRGRLILVVALVLAMLCGAAAVRADETTSVYNQDGFSGVTKTTTDAGTNTTTSVTTASSAVAGELCERTITTTTIGKPVTSEKTVTKDVCYELDTNGKKGKKLRTVTDTVINQNYNEAGGYSQAHIEKRELPSGNIITQDENTCDASGTILSGTRTITYFNPDGTKKNEKKQTYESGAWKNVAFVPGPMTESMTAEVVPEPGMSGNVGDGSNVALPAYASGGAQSQVVFRVGKQDEETGAGGVLVLAENDKEQKKLLRVTPNAEGLVVLGGAILTGLKTLSLLTEIDDHGNPVTASTCTIGTPAHIEGTDPVAKPPTQGPAITEIPSSMQPGEIIKAHVASVDPGSTYFLVDGARIDPLGVSDEAVALKLPESTLVGHRTLQIVSDGQPGGAVDVSVVRLYADPVPPSQPGVDQIVTIHVDGLLPSDRGVLSCEIGGAATMADGSTTASVEVSGGIAQLHIRGVRAGQALLRFHLQVANPDFSA